jgi:Tol biopolymer transport system component
MRLRIILSLAIGASPALLGCSSASDGTQDGTLVLSTRTLGQAPDWDADGYQVDGLPGGPIAMGINDTITRQLAPDTYTLTLSGLAGNCSTAEEQLVRAVSGDEDIEATWEVTCDVLPGGAEVIFDPGTSSGNGAVMFALDGQASIPILPGETVDLGSISPGQHTITIETTTPNCRVTNGTSQSFTILRSQKASVLLEGYCSAGALVFDENVTSWKIHVLNADTSGIHELSGAGVTGGNHPMFSPDGTRIAYVTSFDSLMMMNSDGSNPRLVTQILNVSQPVWSPAGDRIAFTASPGIPPEIYVIDTAGTNLVNVTNNLVGDVDPTWGSTDVIAFASDRSGAMEVYSVSPAGTGLDTLTMSGGYHPVWSPDQSEIAFVSGNQVWIMSPDGSNLRALPGVVPNPLSLLTWSPDGRFIAFYQYTVGLTFAPVDSLNSITVARGNASSYRVSWRP